LNQSSDNWGKLVCGKCTAKLESAFLETTRMVAGTFSTRVAIKDGFLNLSNNLKLPFKKGDLTIIPSPIINYDPNIYSDPHIFKWDRFLNNPKFYKEGKEIKNPNLAFGGGKSLCPGRLFAACEIKLFIVHMLLNFEIDLGFIEAPPFDEGRIGLGLLSPVGDVTFKFKAKY